MGSHGWISVLLGLGLGMKHALEPDHLVAVSTLVRGESRVWRLLKLGALWGAGHLSTVALGVAILTTLRVTLRADHLVLFEAPVAAMLIGLGGWTLLGAVATGGPPGMAEMLSHRHGDADGRQSAGSENGAVHREALRDGAFPGEDSLRASHPARPRERSGWWSYAVGSVHGLAGTGALVMFVAATFPEPRMAVSYVVLFGVGAMIGMALITSTLVWPMRIMGQRPMVYRGVTAVAGAFSVVLGGGIVIEVVRRVWG